MKLFTLLFAVLALANAYPSDYSGKELLFKYTADFRTGVLKPHTYGSQFLLKADLHAQYDEENYTGVFYFKNVLISLYNGELLFEGKQDTKNEEYHQMTKDIAHFEHPFIIELSNNTELFKEIYTSADEPKWIVNMKKSVVSLFQFNWKPFEEQIESTVPTTYTTEEETIYGQCLVSYTVQPENSEWIVTKHYDPKHCTHFSQNVYTNFETSECENGHIDDDSYLTENRRVYHVAKMQGKDSQYFKKIEANADVFVYPFRNNGETKYLHVQQKIEFESFEAKKPITVDSKVPHKLDFSFDETNEKEVIEATTFMYTPYYEDDAKSTKLELCLKTIEKLAQNYSNSFYYNHAIKTLSYFTVEDFETCAKKLPGQDKSSPDHFLYTFYKIVPLVGTKASVVYIKDLIKTKDFDSFTAISMLQYLPFYVLVPTEQMLVDLNEFIDPQYVANVDVKHTAVLAYANLIYRTYKNQPESPVLRKYIKTYYTYLKTATTYGEQLVWLQGLKNIQIGHIWQLLLPIIKGEPVLTLAYNYHLREQAIWGAFPLVREHQQEFYNILWPIITNRHEETALRVAAIKVYLHAKTSTEHLIQLFRFMQTETNPQVYNFLITYLKAIEETYCQTVISKFAPLVLRYLKNYGSGVTTHAFSHDLIDEELGFGGHIHGNQIANEKTNQPESMFVQLDAYALYKTANVYSFYLKHKGLDSITDLVTMRNTHKDLDMHYEYLFMINNKIVFAKYFDTEHPNEFNPTKYFNMHKQNQFLNIMDMFNFNKIVPTDLGLPAIFTAKMPVITKLDFEIEEINGKHTVTFGLQQTMNGHYGSAVYNPMSNVYHGAMREVQYNVSLGLYFDFSKKGISFSLDNFKELNHFVVKTNTQTVVFLTHKTDSSLLSEVSKDFELYVRVNEHSLGQQNFTELTEMKEIGLDFQIEALNCDGYYTEETLEKTIMENMYLSQIGKVSFTQYLLNLYNFLGLHLLTPTMQSCRHEISLLPSESYPVKEFKIDFNTEDYEYKHTDTLQRYEIAPTFTFVKEDSKKTKTYETNFYIAIEKDELEYGAQIHRIAKGQKILNMCVDYLKKFTDGEYNAWYNYYEGYSTEKECVKDDFTVSIYATSTKSAEQKSLSNKTYTYKACDPTTDFMAVDTPVSLDCIKAHTSLRYDTYSVEYENLPKYYETMYTKFWKWIKATYNYDVEEEAHKTMKSNTFSIDVTYPVQYEDNYVDVEVTFPRTTYTFTEEYYPGFLKPMESTHFTPKFECHSNVYSCMTRTNEKVLVGQYISEEKIEELHKYVKVFEINDDFTVEVQRMTKDLMALSFTYNNNTMIVHYDTEHKQYVYGIDQQSLHNMMFAHLDEVKPYGMEMLEIDDTLVFLFHKYQVHVIYNPHYVKIETEDIHKLTREKVHGKCF